MLPLTQQNKNPQEEIAKCTMKLISLGSSIYGKMGNVCPVDLISKNAKEVLKFLCSRLGLALHVEEDVGLGLSHGLLVSQGYSTVIEVEPAALVHRIRCVVARANAVGQAEGQQSETHLTEAPPPGAKQPEEGRYSQPYRADASLFELWGSKFSELKFYKNTLSCPFYCYSQQSVQAWEKLKGSQ